ncbi:MAG: transcription elongation factor [Thermosphaera sp.]|nr:transcription elongation factor [Thermosphaera sp.]
MKYPLDRICIKSGVYCPSCQRKIESGVVSEVDLRVLRELVVLEDKLKFLKKGEYVKSIDSGSEVVVLVKGGFEQVELVQLERELSSTLGRKVRVVEYVSDSRKLIEQLIVPASLLGVNKVWLPTGEEVISIRIPRRDRRIIGKNKEQYEALIEQITGVKARIIFE